MTGSIFPWFTPDENLALSFDVNQREFVLCESKALNYSWWQSSYLSGPATTVHSNKLNVCVPRITIKPITSSIQNIPLHLKKYDFEWKYDVKVEKLR